MQRRITAWLTIFALVASAVLPAHAVVRVVGMADFCSANTQKSAPAPARAHDATCDMCCGCGGATAAPACDATAAPLVAAAIEAAPATAIPAPRAAQALVLARGPPAVMSSPT